MDSLEGAVSLTCLSCRRCYINAGYFRNLSCSFYIWNVFKILIPTFTVLLPLHASMLLNMVLICVCRRVCARSGIREGVCVCVCVYVRACVRACVRASERASERACVRASERACVRASERACVRACVRACMRVRARACTCERMHEHAYTYKHLKFLLFAYTGRSHHGLEKRRVRGGVGDG